MKVQTNYSKLLIKWLEIQILFAKLKNLLKLWLNVEIGSTDITTITSPQLVNKQLKMQTKTDLLTKNLLFTDPWPTWSGSKHFDEIEFTFGHPLKNPRNYSANEIKMARDIITYWTNFVKNGYVLLCN